MSINYILLWALVAGILFDRKTGVIVMIALMICKYIGLK